MRWLRKGCYALGIFIFVDTAMAVEDEAPSMAPPSVEDEAPSISPLSSSVIDETLQFFRTALKCGSEFETTRDKDYKNVVHRGRLTYEFGGDKKEWKVRHLQYISTHNTSTNKTWEDFSNVVCTSAAYDDLEKAEATGKKLTIQCSDAAGDCITQTVLLPGYPFKSECGFARYAPQKTRTYDFCDAKIAANVALALNEVIKASRPVVQAPTKGATDAAKLVPSVGHVGNIMRVALAQDGARLASAGVDRTIRLWDLSSGRLLHSFLIEGHSDSITDIAFSSDLRLAASASYDASIKLWDVATGQLVSTLKAKDGVNAIAFSADGRKLASAHYSKVLVWDAVNARLMRTLSGEPNSVGSVSFSPDGRNLVTGSSNGDIRIWDAVQGRLLRTLDTIYGLSANATAFSPDGKTVAVAGSDKVIRVLLATSGVIVGELRGHTDSVYALAFSGDGKRLASGGFGDFRIWDLASGQVLKKFAESFVRSVAFSRDGSLLVSGSSSGAVTIRNSASGEINLALESAEGVNTISFSPDSRRLVSRGRDALRLWDTIEGRQVGLVRTDRVNAATVSPDAATVALPEATGISIIDFASGKPLRRLGTDSDPVKTLAFFSPDGRRLASTTTDGKISLWDVSSGTLLQTLVGHERQVFSVLFSPDGKLLASISSYYDSVRLWNLDNGRALGEFRAEKGLSLSWPVVFSPGSDLVAVRSAGKIWKTADGTLATSLNGHSDGIEVLAFSPDGQRVATAGNDRSIRIWNADGSLLQTLEGHTDSVNSIAFSPDGMSLASGSDDRTVRLWEIASGRGIRSSENVSAVYQVDFSPNGTRLVSRALDGSAKLWDLKSWELLRSFVATSIAFSPDGSRFASSDGGEIKVWRTATAELMTSLIGGANQDWLAMTPEGFFASSDGGSEMLSLVRNEKGYPIGRMADVLRRPDLVRDKLAGDTARRVRDAAAGLVFDIR